MRVTRNIIHAHMNKMRWGSSALILIEQICVLLIYFLSAISDQSRSTLIISKKTVSINIRYTYKMYQPTEAR